MNGPLSYESYDGENSDGIIYISQSFLGESNQLQKQIAWAAKIQFQSWSHQLPIAIMSLNPKYLWWIQNGQFCSSNVCLLKWEGGSDWDRELTVRSAQCKPSPCPDLPIQLLPPAFASTLMPPNVRGLFTWKSTDGSLTISCWAGWIEGQHEETQQQWRTLSTEPWPAIAIYISSISILSTEPWPEFASASIRISHPHNLQLLK